MVVGYKLTGDCKLTVGYKLVGGCMMAGDCSLGNKMLDFHFGLSAMMP